MNIEITGVFIATLRKEKGLTQKQLAQQVGVTDKAVSKWERGLSLPDTAILISLAEALGVTVTELLQGNRIEPVKPLDLEEVEGLVSQSLEISKEEEKRRWKKNRNRFFVYMLEVFVVLGELWFVYYMGISKRDIGLDLAVMVSLPLIFGLWFLFFIRERLPAFYDKEKISFYSDGVFKLQIPGVHFNNRNWPHIVRAGRAFCLITPVTYPLVYLLLRMLIEEAAWENCRLPVTLVVLLGGLFIPLIVAAKRYE